MFNVDKKKNLIRGYWNSLIQELFIFVEKIFNKWNYQKSLYIKNTNFTMIFLNKFLMIENNDFKLYQSIHFFFIIIIIT